MGKQKAIDIEQELIRIPIGSIEFLNNDNLRYLQPKKAFYLNNDGNFEYRYDIEVICPRLEEIIKDSMYFKFVKDSNLGSTFIYVYRGGYYQLMSETEFKGMIIDYIPSQIRRSKDVDEVFKLLLMENDYYIDNSELNSDYKYINFKNGLLNLETMELESHTPDKFFTVQIPVCYKRLDECKRGTLFDKYLDELVDNDNVMKECLLEAMGLALSNIPGYLTKKAILMIGPKDCGKTQIKKLLTLLLGIKYTSSIELSKMSTNNFATSELYNKRLAGSNDMQYTAVADMGIFKQLTGGDPISVEFKGRGAFSYVFTGLLWFLANDFPKFSGKKEDAVYQRFVVIPCEHVVKAEDQDPELVNKMLRESEYIVSLCIDSLLKLIDRKYKFPESERMINGLKKYEVSNNTLLQFVEECCDIIDDLSPTERMKVSTFKKDYQIWCRDSGVKNMALKNDDIENYLKPKYSTEVVKSSNYYVSNIKLKDDISFSFTN